MAKPRQILIDTHYGLVRTALAEGPLLLDYYEEPPEQGRMKGNIYQGSVKRVESHLQAAFVKFGTGRDGFLPLRDVPSGEKAVKPGDAILVQVVKDEVGDKGAALTTKLSLSGRYLVFMPGKDGDGGISSRVGEEDRAELKRILSELRLPEDASVILRTASLGKELAELQADLDRLVETYREIVAEAGKRKEPGLIFREAPPALRYLREYYAPDVERIWVNREESLEECRKFFFLYEPQSASKVVLSEDGPLMFQRLGLEAEVEKLSLRRVALPSGANIVIDQTEALVAIDVNSAKARDEEHRDLEETVFAVNKEAAVEIARQLRLRDLGGIIIVDFIDMEEEKHRRQVEELMRRSLSADKAKVKVFDISPLGTLQISRQRLRKAGPHFSRLTCEACQGRGWHASPAVAALSALRKMEEKLQGRTTSSLSVMAPYPVANQLLNEFRDHVADLEKRRACAIKVLATAAHEGEVALVLAGGEAKDMRAPQQEEKRARRGSKQKASASVDRATVTAPESPAPGASQAIAQPVAQSRDGSRRNPQRGEGRRGGGRRRGGSQSAAKHEPGSQNAMQPGPRSQAARPETVSQIIGVRSQEPARRRGEKTAGSQVAAGGDAGVESKRPRGGNAPGGESQPQRAGQRRGQGREQVADPRRGRGGREQGPADRRRDPEGEPDGAPQSSRRESKPGAEAQRISGNAPTSVPASVDGATQTGGRKKRSRRRRGRGGGAKPRPQGAGTA